MSLAKESEPAPSPNKLRIAEIFSSIQGEGIWAGIPSSFVRVSGCNLRCQWCDTPYASWNPEGRLWSIADILEEVEKHAIEHVVLTGGEPMLFEAIESLARHLREARKTITVETAGTVFREIPCDLMSVSPKLANSTPSGPWAERHEETRRNIEPLLKLVELYNVQLKFVVNPDNGLQDFDEIEGVLARLPSVRPDRVLVMAEGTDSETLHRRERLIAPALIERSWRLSARLHIDLFGNQRGT